MVSCIIDSEDEQVWLKTFGWNLRAYKFKTVWLFIQAKN